MNCGMIKYSQKLTTLQLNNNYICSKQSNWFPNTLNKGNLENFFFFLASLTLLNVLGFWSVSQR